MNYLPFAFEPVAPTTWAYVASLLMLALFFKFNRCWSIRNLDLLMIILLAPGLLMIDAGRRMEANAAVGAQVPPAMESNDLVQVPVQAVSWPGPTSSSQNEAIESNSPTEPPSLEAGALSDSLDSVPAIRDQLEVTTAQIASARYWQRFGYIWLFSIGALFLLRFLLDPLLVRRPVLEPNLSIGGLVFLACSLMAFLVANIMTSSPTADDLRGAQNAVKMIQREAAQENDNRQLQRRGPGYWLFNLIPIIPSFGETGDVAAFDVQDSDVPAEVSRYVIAARFLAITSQIFVVLGMILFCHYHYDNFVVGVGIATIYLMLPYTAMYNGHVLHALPAALIIWALVSFRRPVLSGLLVGLAIGVSYYPIFLLPLWCSFYWERGVKRFVPGVLLSLGVCIAGLIFTSVNAADFFHQLQAMFGFWQPLMENLEGIWALGWSRYYRLPLLLVSIMLAVSFVWWPRQKNIGTLVSFSAAIMVSVQFWHGFGGGLYIAWYAPLALFVFFRPNLAGRVAVTELAETSRKRHKETAEDILPAV